MDRRNICITHKNCMDGVGVILAVREYDRSVGITNREFILCNYGDPIQSVLDADVIIGDFSFSKNELLALKELANSIKVFDHHATAEESLRELPFCEFDMTKSGAVLVYEHLFPNKKVPILLKYIQDRDLWEWKLENSKEVSAALQLIDNWSYEEFEKYMYDISPLIEQGKIILKYQNKQINNIVRNREKLTRKIIGGHNVICINTTTLISEIGSALSDGEPFIAMYFDTNEKRVYSLRSSNTYEKAVDVSEIAKLYGGGGHKHAAGFSVELSKDCL